MSKLSDIKYLGKVDNLLEELEELSQKIKSIEQENTRLKKELGKLEDEVQNSEIDKEHLEQNIQEIEKINDKLKHNNLALERKFSTQRKKYSRLKSDYKSLYTNSLKLFKDVKDQHSKEFKDLKSANEDFKHKLSLKDIELKKIYDNYNNLCQYFEDIRKDLNVLEGSSKEEQNKILNEIENLKLQKSDLEKQDISKKEEIERINQERLKLENNLIKKDKAHNDLLLSYTKLESNYHSLQEALKEIKQTSAEESKKIFKQLSEISELQDKVKNTPSVPVTQIQEKITIKESDYEKDIKKAWKNFKTELKELFAGDDFSNYEQKFDQNTPLASSEDELLSSSDYYHLKKFKVARLKTEISEILAGGDYSVVESEITENHTSSVNIPDKNVDLKTFIKHLLHDFDFSDTKELQYQTGSKQPLSKDEFSAKFKQFKSELLALDLSA